MKKELQIGKICRLLKEYNSMNFEIMSQFEIKEDGKWSIKLQLREKNNKWVVLDIPIEKTFDTMEKATEELEQYLWDNFKLNEYDG